MSMTFLLLYFCFFLGLLFVAALAAAPSHTLRRVFLGISLGLVNMGALAVLGGAYAVSRLEGSRPPTLLELFSPLWLPILLIVLIDVAILWVNGWRKERI